MTRPGARGGIFQPGDQAHVYDEGKIVNCVVVGVSNDGHRTVTLDSAHGVRYTRHADEVGRGWLMVGGQD